MKISSGWMGNGALLVNRGGSFTVPASTGQFLSLSVFLNVLLSQFFSQIFIAHTMHIRNAISNQLIELRVIKNSTYKFN